MWEKTYDPETVIKYKNSVSQNLFADREIQKKIDHAANRGSQLKFKKYADELIGKNTYFSRTKRDDVRLEDEDFMQTNLMNSYKANFKSANDDDGYCQKCPVLKNHCPHKNKRGQMKDKYSYPIVSNSTYGWLPPVDVFRHSNNLNSNTKSFFDHSHL